MRPFISRLLILTGTLLALPVWAGKLALVIDDFGYRPHNENQVLAMPTAVSVAVLPNAPYARDMATKAHAQGREVLIHLPMAPMSKQPLERDTLRPDMSSEEIARILRDAVNKVPYAVGLNNHMGSAMTASLPGMQKVMQAMTAYRLYFLDSMTIGSSQASQAAAGTGIKVLKRKVFLDDTQNVADIRRQFSRAVEIAQRSGYAIAIGHPHPTTIQVLQQMLPTLPADIVLVRPSQLLNEPEPRYTPVPTYLASQPTVPAQKRLRPIQVCAIKQPLPAISQSDLWRQLGRNLATSPAVSYLKQHWRTWLG
ncbi:divergent polysaccharide deacetylase family protein [Dickeya fangzhongdai]|uniref:divergent polysaccharide deacetylase family protein n=1 Tax=Dickeya fangzhongdai TaxID=1778540 RepID=UPI0004F82F54|nr:divergent polysaccharide deacetylase family protein [Dickeya fangzhongdai]AIR69774.1 sugar deacetylase [Dickeya fangzhongdai]KGT99697.1 sugar deacetylase [Dickeya fangzhongdai]